LQSSTRAALKLVCGVDDVVAPRVKSDMGYSGSDRGAAEVENVGRKWRGGPHIDATVHRISYAA